MIKFICKELSELHDDKKQSEIKKKYYGKILYILS